VFLPIGSNLPFSKLPWVTFAWIGFCAWLYFFVIREDLAQLSLWGDDAFEFTLTHAWAVIPAQPIEWKRLVSYQFVHASWGHLLSNMWYLLVFGWILENAWGSLRYLGLVLVGGAVAVLPEIFVQGDLSPPIVGASGSAAFILGACVSLFPKSKIRMLFLIIPVPSMPSSFFIPLRYLVYFWLILQVSGLATHFWVEAKPVAYTTHLFGFFVGLLVGFFYWLRQKEIFHDVELSGRDLRRFYELLNRYQGRQVAEANALVETLSSKHPHSLSLQSKLIRLAQENKQSLLSEDLIDQNILFFLQLRKHRELQDLLKSHKEHFGALPLLSTESLDDLRRFSSEKPYLQQLLAETEQKEAQELQWRLRSFPSDTVK
jgi:membrane associated rhomboid family serine protease